MNRIYFGYFIPCIPLVIQNSSFIQVLIHKERDVGEDGYLSDPTSLFE